MSRRPLTRPQTAAERAVSLRAAAAGHAGIQARRERRFTELERRVRQGMPVDFVLQDLRWSWEAADKAALRHGRPDIRELLRRHG